MLSPELQLVFSHRGKTTHRLLLVIRNCTLKKRRVLVLLSVFAGRCRDEMRWERRGGCPMFPKAGKTEPIPLPGVKKVSKPVYQSSKSSVLNDYKNAYKVYKMFPPREPAKCLPRLVSSPLLFVYLAAHDRRRAQQRGEEGPGAVHSGKRSLPVEDSNVSSVRKYQLRLWSSLVLLWYVKWMTVSRCMKRHL